MAFYKTAAFKAEKKKWYKKLKNEGFVDVEYGSESLPFINDIKTYEYAKVVIDSSVEYFNLIQRYLAETDISHLPVETQIIYEKHSQGLSIREIQTHLRSIKITQNTSVGLIHKRIRKLKKDVRAWNFVITEKESGNGTE